MRRRNNVISIRFSDNERELLLKKVQESGQTLQTYMIDSALSGRISSKEEIEELKNRNRILDDLDKQLRGMGTGLLRIKSPGIQCIDPFWKRNIYGIKILVECIIII